jgi:hypothetical protein
MSRLLKFAVVGGLSLTTQMQGLTAHAQGQAPVESVLSGQALFRDIERYAAFGVHRYGGAGAGPCA